MAAIGTPWQSLTGSSLSSVEIDLFFPYVSSIIHRGSWDFSVQGDLNSTVQRIGGYRCGTPNNFTRYHFEHSDQAAELTEYALAQCLHRLKPNSLRGASREEVAMEWERIDTELSTPR